MLRRTPLKKGNSKLKKTPLRRGGYIIKSSIKSGEKILYKKEQAENMRIFFLYCWNNLPHYSEIPPYKWLGDEPLNIFFHHCYEKSPYPELKYSISNILRVTGDEHACLNNDLEYFKEAVQKRRYVKDNWEKCIEESKKFENAIAELKKKF